MTFLNPLVLFGLAAAAIPLVLHLLQRRRLRTIEFSTLRFLKEIEQSALRTVKIRQWLLLAIRTLLLIALVLAFARPVLRSDVGGVPAPRSSAAVAILLDDSPSMRIRNERGLLFDQARDAATAIIDASGEGDRIAVIPLSSTRIDTGVPGYRSIGGARLHLQELRATEVRGSMARGINDAVRLLDSALETHRELYVITDGQETQFRPGRGDSLVAPSGPQQLTVVRIPVGHPGNVGVTAVRSLTRIRSAGHTAQIAVELRNFGETPAPSLPIHLYLDGVRVAQQAADVPPRSSTGLTLSLLPRRTGLLRGAIQIEEDGLDLDDTRPFLLSIPGEPKVLIAGTGVRFLPLALTAGGDSAAAGRIRMRQISGAALPSADLSGTDVLIVAGIDRLSPAHGSAIHAYLRRGGAVILFPGSALDPLSYRQNLFDKIGVPGWRPGKEAPHPGGGSSPPAAIASFAHLDIDHPLLAGLFASGRTARKEGPVESPQIVRTAGLRSDPRGNDIITLTNGETFLAESRVGQGRLLLFGVDAGTEWSDLPLKGIFAPLLHRCVAYLTSDPDDDPVEAGTALRFSLPPDGAGTGGHLLLAAPDGSTERLQSLPSPAGTGSEAVGSPALITGVHTLAKVRAGDTILIGARTVVMAEEEGDLRPLGDAELLRASGSGLRPEGSATVITGGSIGTTVRERRVGTELWQSFLLLAAFLAIGEMIVGRERKTEGNR